MITSLQSATKVDCYSAEPLSCHPSLQYLPLCQRCSGQLIQILVLSALLVTPQHKREASCTRSLVFQAFLLLINTLLCFFMSEKTDTTLGLEQKAGKLPKSFGTSVCYGLAAHCCTPSTFTAYPSRADAGHDCSSAQLQLLSVPVENQACYPPGPPNSPRGRHRFPPAYSGRNGGRKVKQPAQGTLRLLRAWQKSLLVWMAQTVLVSRQ